MKISLIQPSRNNLKYLKWSYDSIRKNQGNHEVEICVADDFSNKDGTWKWCLEMMEKDPLFKAIRNEGPTRLGHTILYDRLINTVATNDLCMIYHADMYLCPGALDAIEKHMYTKKTIKKYCNTTGDSKINTFVPNPKLITSLTRIEPPLHPDGPEKILLDCGIEPEEFREDYLLDKVDRLINGGQDALNNNRGPKTTEGIFAPWAFWKKDFQEIGGHDDLFAPQSKEDTDIFNRFHLNGVKFVQTWEGFVYHMTCRGSRFADGAKRNPDGQVFMKNRETEEWLKQNQKSTREFIRKWGHYCKHDDYMKPIVPPKYHIGFRVKNCIPQLLEALEPWCSVIYTDLPSEESSKYIESESMKSSFNIMGRVHDIIHKDYEDIVVEIDGNTFDNEEFRHIQHLPEIIQGSGEIGTFELGNLKLTINSLNTYEKDLIVCSSQYVLENTK